MLMVIKNKKYVLYMGLIWGAAELLAGYFLHMSSIPLSGSLLMPVGIICMTEVYLKTGRLSATVITSLIAASIKLLTLCVVPAAAFYIVVNPVAAIILEGLILTLPVSLLGRNVSNTLFSFVILYVALFFYKICFLSFQNLLKGETGAPALGELSISGNFSFLITETFITIFIVAAYLLLREAPHYKSQKTLYL